MSALTEVIFQAEYVLVFDILFRSGKYKENNLATYTCILGILKHKYSCAYIDKIGFKYVLIHPMRMLFVVLADNSLDVLIACFLSVRLEHEFTRTLDACLPSVPHFGIWRLLQIYNWHLFVHCASGKEHEALETSAAY